MSHDYPACATFRGGKCTCDEADNLCPKCGSDCWDRITAERGMERDVPFNRCGHCQHEWKPDGELWDLETRATVIPQGAALSAPRPPIDGPACGLSAGDAAECASEESVSGIAAIASATASGGKS